MTREAKSYTEAERLLLKAAGVEWDQGRGGITYLMLNGKNVGIIVVKDPVPPKRTTTYHYTIFEPTT